MNWDIEKLMQAIDLPGSTEDQEKMKEGLLQREMVMRLADAPAPYKYYEVNYDGLVYVSQQVIADRNNRIFDWWNLEVLEVGVDQNTWTAWAMVKMTASLLGQTRSIMQRGVNKVTILKDNDCPSGDDQEQAVKAAISDGMKKCSSWFGIFSHVFRGDIFAILPHRNKEKKDIATNEQYIKLLSHFNLRGKEYYHGIPILPDEFRGYYVKMGWKDGIFKKDFLEVCYKNQGNSEGKQPRAASKTSGQTISKHQADYVRKMARRVKSEASDEEIMRAISRHLREVHSINLPENARIEEIPKDYGQIVIDFWREHANKRKAS
jgi:hypothetical protein